jgi:hypothetical protein
MAPIVVIRQVTQVAERDHHQSQHDGGDYHLEIDDGDRALDLRQYGGTQHRARTDAAEQQSVPGGTKAQVLFDDYRKQRP